MSKYIIKNCPCFNEGHPMLDYYGECLSLTDDAQVCQDCTDCIMKQIVELCEEESSLVQHKQRIKVKGLNKLADKILQLLDIQEVK